MQGTGIIVPYVLGIDSGGTKYLARAAAPDGTVLGEYRGPGCSHYEFPETEAARRIQENLTGCLAAFGGRPQDCLGIVCGTTGYDSPEDGVILQRIYKGLQGFSCPVLCMNDVELAFHIACGKTGVLILSGTGSNCYGVNRQGRALRVGGWPSSVFGDEGSGRYIDALAMRHYSRWMDGCRKDSELIRTIQETTGVCTRKGLADYAMDLSRGRRSTPNLGAAVTRAAEGGDGDAAEILRDAAGCLFRLTCEAIRELGMEEDDPLPVGVWGSVLMQSAPVRMELASLLRAAYPRVILSVPEKDAAQGAVEIALEELRERAEHEANHTGQTL